MDRILWNELTAEERQALIDAYELSLDALDNNRE